LLGVMNERFLFNGKEKVPCKWKLFVATCNQIPKEEEGSPFWDRFILKMNVSRVTAGELTKYFKKGDRKYQNELNIAIPTDKDMESLDIPVEKLQKFLEVGYNSCSDRTLSFLPRLVKAVSFIWECSIEKALVKTADIMIGRNAAQMLLDKLVTPELKNVMVKVESLHTLTTREEVDTCLSEIEALISGYTANGRLDPSQVKDIE